MVSYHHHWLDPSIRSVSKVTTVLSNVSSVFQLFSFLVVCSSMISKGFGFVAFCSSVETSSVCIRWYYNIIIPNEELNDLYSSPNIVRVIKLRRMRWAGHVVRMGEERGMYRVLVGKPEGRRPMGRSRRRWVDDIRTDLQEVGCGYMDWIGLTQDRDKWRTLVSAVMNLRVPWNAVNFLTSCKPVSFSRRTLHRGISK